MRPQKTLSAAHRSGARKTLANGGGKIIPLQDEFHYGLVQVLPDV
jgi:hypothetical protein